MEYSYRTHGEQSNECHCGGTIKSIYWGGPYRRVCGACGCNAQTDKEDDPVVVEITSVSCQMKYVILKSHDETKERIVHANDVEKLIKSKKAIWLVSANGVRYAKLLGPEE